MAFVTEAEALASLHHPENVARGSMPSPSQTPEPSSDSREPVPNSEPIIPEVVHRGMSNGGRPFGTKNVPMPIRAMVGILAQGTTIANAAAIGQVNERSARAYSHGEVTPGRKNSELSEIVATKKQQVHDKVVDKLLEVLNVITDEKIVGIKSVKEASEVAKNLASVADRTREKNEAPTVGQVIIMAPPEMPLDQYQIHDLPS